MKFVSNATLDYLSINTTFDLKYPIKEIVTPFICIGPHFDYLLIVGDSFASIKELKNTSIGLIIGSGLKYSISNFQIGLRADYYFDFTKIAKWESEFETEYPRYGGEITAKIFSINLFVGLKIK